MIQNSIQCSPENGSQNASRLNVIVQTQWLMNLTQIISKRALLEPPIETQFCSQLNWEYYNSQPLGFVIHSQR